MSLATLSIDMVANTATFEKDLKRTAEATGAVATQIARSVEATKSAFLGVAGLVSVDMFANMVTSSAEYSDQIGKMAQKIGTTSEAFSVMSYAASLADVSNETLVLGLKKLSTEVASGGEKLAQLGIKTKDAAGNLRSNSDIMGDLAERFSKMKDGAIKTAWAVDLLGKSGAELIPLLNGGAKGLKDAADEAKRFGLIVGKDAVIAAELFNDNLTRLKALSKGATVALTSDLVKGLGETTKAFLEANAEGGKLAGIIAGFRTFVTGNDQFKNDKALVDQTEALLNLQNGLDKLRAHGYTDDTAAVRSQKAQIAAVNEQIRVTQAYRKVLKDASDRNAAGPQEDGPPLKQPKAPHAVKALNIDNQIALANYVKGLETSIERTLDLTEVEKSRLFLSTLGKTGEVAQVQELVLGMAKRIDQEKELGELLKLKRAAATAAGDAVNKENDWLAGIYAQTPTAQLELRRKQLLDIKKLFDPDGKRKHALTEEEATKWTEMTAVILGTSNAVKEVEGDFASLGATFSSSLEDAIVNGNDLRSVIQGLGQDILRITVRKTITEPIGNAITGAFSGFSLGKLFGFADGGVMTGRGPLPLRAYASGGVASSPQLAMYGEGSTPEAFVPLPDGRHIPVQMRGGGDGRAVVVNISNVIGNVASQTDVISGMKAVRAQIIGELARGQRMGRDGM